MAVLESAAPRRSRRRPGAVPRARRRRAPRNGRSRPPVSDLTDGATISQSAILVSALAGLACIVALTLPTLFVSASPAGARAAEGRQARTTLAQRLGLDLALVAVAGVALWQLRLYGAPLTRNARGTLGLDPLLVAAPAIGLVGGAVLALRVVPRVAELGERLLVRGRGLVGSLGGRQLARRPLRYTRAALLLMLAAALGTLAAAHAATWTRSQADQAAYRAVADVRVIASDYSSLPSWAAGPEYRAIPGVTAATPVIVAPFDVGRTIRDGSLVGLDPKAVGAGRDAAVDRLRRDPRGHGARAAAPLPSRRRRHAAARDAGRALAIALDAAFRDRRRRQHAERSARAGHRRVSPSTLSSATPTAGSSGRPTAGAFLAASGPAAQSSTSPTRLHRRSSAPRAARPRGDRAGDRADRISRVFGSAAELGHRGDGRADRRRRLDGRRGRRRRRRLALGPARRRLGRSRSHRPADRPNKVTIGTQPSRSSAASGPARTFRLLAGAAAAGRRSGRAGRRLGLVPRPDRRRRRRRARGCRASARPLQARIVGIDGARSRRSIPRQAVPPRRPVERSTSSGYSRPAGPSRPTSGGCPSQPGDRARGRSPRSASRRPGPPASSGGRS